MDGGVIGELKLGYLYKLNIHLQPNCTVGWLAGDNNNKSASDALPMTTLTYFASLLRNRSHIHMRCRLYV